MLIKLAVLAASWIIMIIPAWSVTHLSISLGNSEQPALCLPLNEGVSFQLEFINSIYLAPVLETFVYEQGSGICLVSVESLSAGVFEYYDLIPDNQGKAFVKRCIGDVRLMSHDYNHHRLIVGTRIIHLSEFAVNGKPVIIRVDTANECLH